MLSTIVQNLLRPGKATPPSSEYEEQIRALEEERAQLGTRITALELQKADLLLSASDEDLAVHASEIAAARLRRERIDAALLGLEENLERSRDAERVAAVRARIAEGKRLQARGVALIARYGTKAAELVALLDELEEIDGTIERIRAEVKEAGFGDEAPATAEATARPDARKPLYAREHSYVAAYSTEWQNHQGGVQLPSASGHGGMIRGTGPRIASSEETRAQERVRARERAEMEWRAKNPEPTDPVVVRVNGKPETQSGVQAHARFLENHADWSRRHDAFLATLD